MRKLITRLLALTAAVTFGGVLVAAAPASASGDWPCPATNSAGVVIAACIYPDINGGGDPYLAGINQGCHNLTGGWNDHASSIHVNSAPGYRVAIWMDANCSGVSWSISPGDQGNFVGAPAPPNDQISSWASYPPGH